MELVAYRPSGA